LDSILSEYGNISKLDTDNAAIFHSQRFEEFTRSRGIKHRYTAPLWPQANRAETCMKGLKKTIQKAEVKGSNYRQELNIYLSNYRATPHPATGRTPAELLFNGRTFRTKIPAFDNNNDLLYDTEVRKADEKAKMKYKKQYDSIHNTKEPVIQEGDTVIVRQEQRSKNMSAYSPQPYKVVKVQGTTITATSHGK